MVIVLFAHKAETLTVVVMEQLFIFSENGGKVLDEGGKWPLNQSHNRWEALSYSAKSLYLHATEGYSEMPSFSATNAGNYFHLNVFASLWNLLAGPRSQPTCRNQASELGLPWWVGPRPRREKITHRALMAAGTFGPSSVLLNTQGSALGNHHPVPSRVEDPSLALSVNLISCQRRRGQTRSGSQTARIRKPDHDASQNAAPEPPPPPLCPPVPGNCPTSCEASRRDVYFSGGGSRMQRRQRLCGAWPSTDKLK